MDQTVILPCDVETARFYGDVKDILRKKGNPIHENDIWIAATALQHDLSLISRDEHFSFVDDLEVEAW